MGGIILQKVREYVTCGGIIASCVKMPSQTRASHPPLGFKLINALLWNAIETCVSGSLTGAGISERASPSCPIYGSPSYMIEPRLV